jgi:hypothetical protein
MRKAYNNDVDSDIKNTGASGAIPRNDWGRMDKHAAMFYEEIRRRKTDVQAISKNTGFPETDIEIIKQHVFFNEYDLGEDKPRRFDPSYDMAVSWQRLIDGRAIQEMDIVLLKHELLEYEYISAGETYAQAHMLANERYNYEAFTAELDRKAGIK